MFLCQIFIFGLVGFGFGWGLTSIVESPSTANVVATAMACQTSADTPNVGPGEDFVPFPPYRSMIAARIWESVAAPVWHMTDFSRWRKIL